MVGEDVMATRSVFHVLIPKSIKSYSSYAYQFAHLQELYAVIVHITNSLLKA